MSATGTIYALIDPRDDEIRYIGQTVQALPARLRGKYAPRVHAWMAEVADAGMSPRIVPVREDVPVADLLAAEREEITRILVSGGSLLNEQATAGGREYIRQREQAERVTAETAAWRHLAGIAMDMLGGPLPPGDLSGIEIPETAWRFITKVGPDYRERMLSLVASDYRLWCALNKEQEEAVRQLWRPGPWGIALQKGGDRFTDHAKLNVSAAATTPCATSGDVSRYLSLTIWYMVAAHPWRHLAELAGLTAGDESFIAWAGKGTEVREAMKFLASYRPGALDSLPYRWYSQYETGPGHMLAAVAAAYSGAAPEAIRRDLVTVLSGMADDHQVTRPMAELLMQLKPGVLDAVFGKDVAAEIDHDLGLAPGISGRVLQALGQRVGHINDGKVRRAIDRSVGALPTVGLPDYREWSGPSPLAAQVISASLALSGLAEPAGMSSRAYLAETCRLWTPQPVPRVQEAA